MQLEGNHHLHQALLHSMKLLVALFAATFVAAPALAEPSHCWSTLDVNHRTGQLKPFRCDVAHRQDGRFNVRIGTTSFLVDPNFDDEVAYVTFDDGDKRVFGMMIDDDYDIRLSGKGDFEMIFRMPADLRASVIRAVEEEQAPARRRGTLSETPFRF